MIAIAALKIVRLLVSPLNPGWIATSVSALRKREQGQRHPHGAALTLLRVMDKEPEAVVHATKAA